MSELENLKVDEIEPDPNNPREYFPEEELNRLAESIDQVGVLVPVVVYEHGSKYRLLDGERRWRCSSSLGLEEIPAVVVNAPSEIERLTQMFNIHLVREQWQDIPTAHALKRLIDETGVTSTAELSRMTGLSSNQISRYKFALDLPTEIKNAIEDGVIPLNYFYEVSKAIINPIEKHRPNLFAEFSKEQILQQFMEKRLAGTIPDIVSVRDAQYIVRKAAEDDPDCEVLGPLDETLRQLITDVNLSVTDAYDDTVMIAVEADKLESRVDKIILAFERLIEKASDDSGREAIKVIGQKLIDRLSDVIK